MYTQRLLLLSVLLWSHSEAIVVDSVSDCEEFFLRGTPPQIPGVLEDGEIQDQNRYKIICQVYKNRRKFFTLYDTSNKIPVFSAYIFKGNQRGTKRPRTTWLIEPQLEINMQIKCGEKPVYENQASFYEYINKDYDRGHLFPSSYGETQDDKCSTFTLTNVVPQDKTFNNGSWNKMENCTKCVMKKHCLNKNNKIEGFLVTGAEPGDKKLNNKINIPSVMWSAFCCYNNKEDKWFASAHWGNNVPDLTEDQYLETRTVNELYIQFSKNTDFKLFSDECTLHDTVTQFYPELNAENKYCNCPPSNSPVNNSPDDKSLDDKSLDNNSPDNKSPDEKPPDDKSPDDNSPDDKTLDDKSPDDKLPDDKSNDDKSPDNNSPDNKSPDNKSPDKNSPDDNSPDDKTPDDKSNDDKSNDDKSPDDKSNDDKSNDDKSPDDKSNDDKSNHDKSPDDKSPDDYSPDNKSPDDKSLDDKSQDDKSAVDTEAIDSTGATAMKTIKSYLSEAYERVCSLIQRLKQRVGL